MTGIMFCMVLLCSSILSGPGMKIDVAFFDQPLAHALLRFGQPKEIAQGYKAFIFTETSMRRANIWKYLFKNRLKSTWFKRPIVIRSTQDWKFLTSQIWRTPYLAEIPNFLEFRMVWKAETWHGLKVPGFSLASLAICCKRDRMSSWTQCDHSNRSNNLSAKLLKY